jgi:hypothetical protein
MFSVKTQEDSRKKGSADHSAGFPSQALQWIWNYLQDVRNPHVLECGTVSSATVSVLMRRHAKIYVADLIAPLQRNDPAYWQHSGKQTIFYLDELLNRIPDIPCASLRLICCWHLLDLVPPGHLPELVKFLLALLEPGGIFYCFLRESNLVFGKEGRWRLENLTTLGADRESVGQFSYTPLSNREVEKLTAGYSLKTFLTRSHRREVVVLRVEEEV